MSNGNDYAKAFMMGAVLNAFASAIGDCIRFMFKHPIITLMGFLAYIAFQKTYEFFGLDVMPINEIVTMSPRELDNEFSLIDCTPLECIYTKNSLGIFYQGQTISGMSFDANIHKIVSFDDEFYCYALYRLDLKCAQPISANVNVITWRTQGYDLTLTIADTMRPNQWTISRNQ
jgi:hypothetical protein